jgi:hypothetical protein
MEAAYEDAAGNEFVKLTERPAGQPETNTIMGLKFAIAGTRQPLQTHTLSLLGDMLTSKVVGPFLAAHGVRWDPRFNEFFTHHSESNPFEATGTIEFFPPPMFLGHLNELTESIKAALDRLGIKTGPFVPEDYEGRMAVRVIHIPITENPTVDECPPEVTMSANAGRIVLRDLLGIQPKNGRYEFATAEALQRLDSVTEDRITRCSSSPLRDPKSPRGVNLVASPFAVKRVHRCLGELRRLVQWARTHNYDKICAS